MTADSRYSDLDGGPGTYEVSIFAQLENGLLTKPNEPAVTVLFQPSDHLSHLVAGIPSAPVSHDASYLQWTFSQLHGAAMKMAIALRAKKVNTRATLLVLLPPGIEFCIWLWAAALLKMPLSVLDPDSLSPDRHEELSTLISWLKPAVAVVDKREDESSFPSHITADTIPDCLVVLANDGGGESSGNSASMVDLADSASSVQRYDDEEEAILQDARRYEPELMAYYIFTSGTSAGKPKGCPQRIRMAAHCVRHWQSWDTAPRASVRVQLYTPTFRVSGIYSPLRIWSLAGSTLIPSTTFDPAKIIDAAEKHRTTTLGGTPSMLHAYVNDPTFSARNLDSVDLIALGADSITPAAIATARSAFPSARVAVLYGMTEGGALLGWPFSRTPAEQIPLFGEICPMGEIKPGVRLRIRDPATGMVVKRNEPGEILISGVTVITEYLGGLYPEAFFDDEELGCRWYCTGDLGMVSDEGLVYVLGRQKDIIKRSGASLVPAAMESISQKCTGSEAAVVAIPSTQHGEEPFAVVANFGGKSEDELKAEVVRRCDRHHVLAGVVDLGRIGLDAFPLNPTRKIVKTEVKAALLAHLNHPS